MTNKAEIAVPESHADVIATAQGVTLASQLAWAEEIAKSGIIPEAFRDKPENVLVALEWGRELGLSRIASVNRIYVVKGTPTLKTEAMLMLARAAGHRVRTEGDSKQATCEIIRADDPEYPHRITYTLDDARQAGLLGNTGWKNNPSTMLRWRAIANAVRLACPEVLGGISYTPEEVEEISRRNQTRPTVAVQVHSPVSEEGPSVQDYMKRLKMSGADLRSLACRVLDQEVSGWRDLDEQQRRLVHEALARWDAEGADPTLAELVDAELVNPVTGEVIEEQAS